MNGCFVWVSVEMSDGETLGGGGCQGGDICPAKPCVAKFFMRI